LAAAGTFVSFEPTIMKKTVRYISISHETATVGQRERYFIPEEEKGEVVSSICNKFPDITGLFLLVTCNRTEIYFEAASTPASDICDFLRALKSKSGNNGDKRLFKMSDKTGPAVRHLLKVSSGLSSQVLGDAEIVHQIKKAYHYCIAKNLQGSLLERAMQTVFKAHKRISNETGFRDGTTSVAYKSLKAVSETFGGARAATKKILLIGTGDIARQVLRYNAKFNFQNLYLSNRTRANAVSLAAKHGCSIYEWEKVVRNEFEDFDVIISAVSNCHHLIGKISPAGKQRILIDLALPGNINSALSALDTIRFYDLDAISAELEDTRDKRISSIGQVNAIIKEELKAYLAWYREAPLRAFLAEYKIELNRKVVKFYQARSGDYTEETISTVTDRVMRKLMKETRKNMPSEALETIIREHAVL
jgi:glutamyl-tRNA reductase